MVGKAVYIFWAFSLYTLPLRRECQVYISQFPPASGGSQGILWRGHGYSFLHLFCAICGLTVGNCGLPVRTLLQAISSACALIHMYNFMVAVVQSQAWKGPGSHHKLAINMCSHEHSNINHRKKQNQASADT